MVGGAVELCGVEKRFGDARVVADLTLEVAGGELLVLVGPSGCGKSTCLRLIAGLEELSAGEIRIGGRSMDGVPPRDRDIGMVFQSYALYPHMTVRENLAFGLRLRGRPAAEIAERVGEVARMLDIAELLDRRPRELSGGQRQRVAMGRALARRPRVLLFDEPLSNLDAALRVQMRGEIAALHRRLGTTAVYVTHDQVEAMTLADRIALLHRGVLQQVGPPLDLWARPANRFVAGFLGSPAMNFVEGRLARDGSGVAFVAAGLRVPLPMARADGAATLGVRPGDARLDPAGAPGEVEVVERLGADAYAHVRIEAGRVVVAAAADVRPGDRVGVQLDGARAYLFDADGKTVLAP